MLYYLSDYMNKVWDLPGVGVFRYLSFRAAAAMLLSLFLSLVVGKYMIRYLQKKQIGETIRDLGLQGQMEKKGTPTMGGLIIIMATLVPVLLFNRLDNIYVILMIVTTVWLGCMGFIDDYIKVFRHNKNGMAGKYKIVGQVGLGLIVGLTMCYHPDIVVSQKQMSREYVDKHNVLDQNEYAKAQAVFEQNTEKALTTTIPFVKNSELDYSVILTAFNKNWAKYSWIVFVLLVVLVVTAVSNGANLTDGMDGLASGTSAIIGATLGLLAWVSGNVIFADYLNIMYIPHTGELVVFIAAFVGALIGFLWYNAYPAQVFMGDTGSLTIGGIIAVFAILIRKELLLPILCGIFLVESLSVMMQVTYFKYTKRICC
ncbi:MAG: phospho-N-acetylmuramoyl-pentapeptide-transferase, partial [Bacteroidales bacterium]|nr:phospho-N-acetylmuramoyl-pentapeptide-transferase [Bacteroidales bacterium]